MAEVADSMYAMDPIGIPPSPPVHDQGNVPHITFLNGQLSLSPLRPSFVVCVFI